MLALGYLHVTFLWKLRSHLAVWATTRTQCKGNKCAFRFHERNHIQIHPEVSIRDGTYFNFLLLAIKDSKYCSVYPPAKPSPEKWKTRLCVMKRSNSSLLLRKEQNIPVTTGNDDKLLHVSLYCSEVYRKNLNILCNRTLKLFLQNHSTETLLDRRDYL